MSDTAANDDPGRTNTAGVAPQPGAPANTAHPTAAMQAVVVVHGMGEQRPMDTIKAFVNAVWETDPDITRNGLPDSTQVWSKPDQRTGSLELRRITTRETIPDQVFPGGVRTDFYELYWADLTAGSTWDQFTSWVCGLLFRPWSRVPPDVHSAWLLLWFLSLVVVALAIIGILPASVWSANPALAAWQWLFVAAAAAATAIIHNTVTTTFGRVVRYTQATPDNIAARANVRDRGLKLLRSLHDETTDYKRIIVVAHSLGSILAHDLLSYFWAERDAARKIPDNGPEFDDLCALESAAHRVGANPDTGTADAAALREYFAAQRRLRLRFGKGWLISDFVTLGSPLTHAEFLLASSKADLEQRKIARELPESPPYRESLDPIVLQHAVAIGKLPVDAAVPQNLLMSFPVPPAYRVWELHHAAPFAVVRWTNIYDPAKFVFFGDVIGGPLAAVFGPAIIDVNLKGLRGQSYCFTHTKYWTLDGDKKHIAALRAAVNLLDRPDVDPNHV